jgi:alpha,alpha-trehalase
VVLSNLYEISGPTRNTSQASNHRTQAASLREAILDLHWDSSKLAFYDFNMTANARNDIFTTATFYPLWAGIVPDELTSNSTNAFGFFASVNMVLNRYNGTFPVTFIESGLQWDAPNAWPPHQYIALQALRALPANVSSGALPTPPQGQNSFALVPQGQLGLNESSLPVQTLTTSTNATTSGTAADVNALNGTVVNGGNASDSQGWRDTLARELANRYITSALCSWYSTGGSISGFLSRLPDAALNVSGSVNNTGNVRIALISYFFFPVCLNNCF